MSTRPPGTALAGLALGDPELLGEGLELRAEMQRKSGLDPRSFALVKIAALIALDAPPASYLWQVGNALDAGATPEDLMGVLLRHRAAGRRAEDGGGRAGAHGGPRPVPAGRRIGPDVAAQPAIRRQ